MPVLAPLCNSLEMIFVDDGSSDATFAAIESFRARFPSTLALRHERNRGLGASLRSGFQKATGDAVLTLDADLTFHPREASLLLDAYGPGVDCVTGSPFEGKMDGVDPFRAFLSWSVNAIYKILLGAEVSSVSSIFRLYRAARLSSLKFECDSFDINAEILFKIMAAGGHVREVPVTLGKRMHGVSKINVAREIKNHLKMFWRIIRWKIKNQK